MTYLDTWMLLSMVFVGLATFEFAICLSIRFGKQVKISSIDRGSYYKEAEDRCRKIDRFALRIFMVTYALSVSTYHYNLYTKS